MLAATSVKRRRDDEPEPSEEDWIREKKKPRPLPFRTSPVSKHTTLFSHQLLPPTFSPAVTPVESSDEDNNTLASLGSSPARQRRLKKDDLPFLQIRVDACSDTDSDLEMTDSIPKSATTNAVSPFSAGLTHNWNGSAVPSPIPHLLVNQSLNLSGGRTATPIYGHFDINGVNGDAVMQDSGTPTGPPTSSRGGLAPFSDGEDWWRRRRLPSPISEDEISPTTTTTIVRAPELAARTGAAAVGEPDTWMLEDTTNESQCRGISEQSLCDLQQQQQQHAQGTCYMEKPSGWALPITPPPIPESASTNLPPGSGRARMAIAMGYRADCDKCQQRVPGHYSHIIRS
ncbi:hypothetical protein AJ80_03278 [Polytolypa hystricis UAMH7299]|uniref:Uncharacterized protein n=1 Tax=Polytolypa hystricis (strain UAMH7299) TaxID=1447883 RepID=A0A2B7YJX7_POLH7|nr:hypothetical protein AJ80_03278 [Polytolypa hystricis UAMH7299]